MNDTPLQLGTPVLQSNNRFPLDRGSDLGLCWALHLSISSPLRPQVSSMSLSTT